MKEFSYLFFMSAILHQFLDSQMQFFFGFSITKFSNYLITKLCNLLHPIRE